MRTVTKVFGWIATGLVFLLLVALELVPAILPELFDPPDWLTWLVLVAFGALAGWTVVAVVRAIVDPSARAARRAARQDAHERRQRMESFKLD